MWVNYRDWLRGDVDIPDDDALGNRSAAVRRKPGTEKWVELESKREIVRRGGVSPDCGDAGALTHAFPDPSEDMADTSSYRMDMPGYHLAHTDFDALGGSFDALGGFDF